MLALANVCLKKTLDLVHIVKECVGNIMNKLILISLVIFFTICSRSWAENSNLIPDGKWHGNLAVGGKVHCGANIRSITIINNVATTAVAFVINPPADLDNMKFS